MSDAAARNAAYQEALKKRAADELRRRERMAEQKEAAEADLLSFIRMMWPALEPAVPLVEGWVLDILCDCLMAVTDGHLTKICINVPPGSTKSTLLNVLWPAWEWGPQGKPHLRYISTSYSTDVPERDNLRFARIINHPVYQKCWGDKFKIVREGAGLVENDATGWKRVTSTGGSTTGFRGDRVLVDDANNPMTVESEDVRKTTEKYMREILPDRVNSLEFSAMINLQQRTHERDATGVLLEYGRGWQFLCIPMEFDPLRIGRIVLRRDENGNPVETWVDPRSLDDDGKQLEGLILNERGEPALRMGSPMAQAEGELCWPERFPPDEVEKLKAEKGAYAWSAQYGQIPGVRGGAIVRRDWWKLWRGDYPEVGTVIVAVDTAIEEGESNDYNAVTVWAAFEGQDGSPQFLLCHGWRDRLPLAQLVFRIAETCKGNWELRGRTGSKADYLVIEHKTRGRDVAAEITRLYQAETWETILVRPQGDKVSRLKAVEHMFSGDARKDPMTGIITFVGGVIWAPDKDWTDEIISEVAAFPYGAHDDYVDSSSLALSFARKNGVILRKVEYDAEELERNRFKKQLSVPYSIGSR